MHFFIMRDADSSEKKRDANALENRHVIRTHIKTNMGADASKNRQVIKFHLKTDAELSLETRDGF